MANMDTSMKGQSNWTSTMLYIVYVIFLALSLGIVAKIVYVQYFWHPEDGLVETFGTFRKDKKEIPNRGDILSYDGKILATSEDLYQIFMDCTIQADNYAKNTKKGPKLEDEWRQGARELSEELANLFGDKTADEYYKMIIDYRVGDKPGRKRVKIGGQIDYQTLLKVKSFPLYSKGRNTGGIIVDTIHTRVYPYGSLARKAIGQVKNNTEVTNDLTGIEGKYNFTLHGTDGRTYYTRTDGIEDIQDFSRKSVAAIDGLDVRTTINIEYQNIADKALRKILEGNEEIAGGCVMVMETKTGAIRAMVNLRRDDEGSLGETYNYIMWQANNPGSVFKAVTLMALIDDGKVNISDMIPTFGGNWYYKGQQLPFDDYVTVGNYPSGQISVGQALAISSNHVFRYLAAINYGEHPEKFIQKLYEYKLLEKYDFDIEGLATPIVRKPTDKGWSPIDLPLIAMGYSVNVTPLHVITFYNAIANNGKVMKPYMVEDIEDNGKVVQKKGPEVLSGAICKQSTVDSLKKGLLMVTELVEPGAHHSGTGSTAFKNAPYRLAGKTGTSRVEFANERNGKTVYSTEDSEGRHVHQGSFVGFFPVEDPQYTVMSVTYSKPTHVNVYGAISSKVVREICDQIYLLSPEWGESLSQVSPMPVMEKKEAVSNERGEVPDVTGLSLNEAIYAIENSGYRCSYTGVGHVAKQSPEALTKLKAGETVKITLK